jgi:hypothetical protein
MVKLPKLVSKWNAKEVGVREKILRQEYRNQDSNAPRFRSARAFYELSPFPLKLLCKISRKTGTFSSSAVSPAYLVSSSGAVC